MSEPDLQIAFRMRTVRIGVQVTLMAVALFLLVPVLPGRPAIRFVPYAAIVTAAAAGALVVSLAIPWVRLFAAGWGERAMYIWSALDILLVTLAAAATGGPRSEVVYLYALTTVFFAASYPGRGQLGLFAFTGACYLTLSVLWSPAPPVEAVVVRLAVTAMVWFMAGFLARERVLQAEQHLASRQEVERRAELLGVLARTAASITQLDSDQVLAGVADSLVELGFDLVNFNLLEDGGRSYRVAHARGLPAHYAESVHPSSLGMVALVIQHGGPVVVNDYGSHPLAAPGLRDIGVHSVIAAPVWVEGELAAVLVGGRLTPGELPGSEVEVFETLTGLVGRALENARRFETELRVAEQASVASLTDELTGVGNRRQANMLLATLRPGDALLLIDLDRFKSVNDQHGHPVGDEVLVQLGSFLRNGVRGADDVARYGGEEFLVVLRSTEEAAIDTAERLLQGWNAQDPRTTFSAGVAVHVADRPYSMTIAEADAALYAAKRLGRNRICEYSTSLHDGVGFPELD